MKIASLFAAPLLTLSLLAAPALADDRAPTPEERAQIEAKLTELGYSSWKGIELDDGLWEIDDASNAAGEIYDLKLNKDTLEMVAQERD